ncbi:MAG: diguanylate cyclase [Planctomycetota bacterium]
MVETIDDNPDREADAKLRASGDLRIRLIQIILAPLVGGFIVGRADTSTDLGLLLALAGLAIFAGGAIWLSRTWIALPMMRLAVQIDRVSRSERQVHVRELPTDRQDELGRIARSVRQLVIHRIRDHHDARQLRRTLDDRVTRATHRAVNTLNKMAMRDPLTDLGNRRFLDTHLPSLIEASHESDTDLVCVLLDMDCFKQVNDTLGHATGDDLLVTLADLIRAAVRENDLAIRLGGDEFVIFLPGASLDRAEQFIHHIRQLYRQRAAALLGPNLRTDLSAGAASLQHEPCTNAEELLQQADAHLYEAKRNGKGITCTRHGCVAA